MAVKLSIKEMRALRNGDSVTLEIHRANSSQVNATVEGEPWTLTNNWKEPDTIQLNYYDRATRRTEDFRFTEITLYR